MEASNIELAKRLKSIRDIVPPEQFDAVCRILLPEEKAPDIERAMRGLSEEDEFALICYLMGTATHLVPLGQAPIIGSEHRISDFLARFQPGCFTHNLEPESSSGFRCLVEVKSTSERWLTLRGKDLRWRRRFASDFGLPLLVAVRFLQFGGYAAWAIVDITDPALKTVKIGPEAIGKGVRHILWNEKTYRITEAVSFERVYDDVPNPDAMYHPDFGYQREFRVFYGDSVAIEAGGGDAAYASAFFECFRPEVITSAKRGTTTVVREKPSVSVCSECDFLYTINHLPRDPDGQLILEASRFVAFSDTKPDLHLFTRDKLNQIADILVRRGLLHPFGWDTPDAHLAAWMKYGGRLPEHVAS